LGPGSFTGVRVALAFCKGLSAGLEIPLLGLPTPDALAAPFVFLKDRYLCPLIDAKKGEVFFAFYRTAGGEVSRVSEIRSSTPEDLVTRVPPSCVCFGTGVPLCRKSFEVIGGLLMVERGFAQVSGEVLLKEGLARYEKGQPTSTEPIYGRRSEAEIKLKLEVS
jgi:tRNA threonylcarbamoyladenosine biosynthesis protein TsaB